MCLTECYNVTVWICTKKQESQMSHHQIGHEEEM